MYTHLHVCLYARICVSVGMFLYIYTHVYSVHAFDVPEIRALQRGEKRL